MWLLHTRFFAVQMCIKKWGNVFTSSLMLAVLTARLYLEFNIQGNCRDSSICYTKVSITYLLHSCHLVINWKNWKIADLEDRNFFLRSFIVHRMIKNRTFIWSYWSKLPIPFQYSRAHLDLSAFSFGDLPHFFASVSVMPYDLRLVQRK